MMDELITEVEMTENPVRRQSLLIEDTEPTAPTLHAFIQEPFENEVRADESGYANYTFQDFMREPFEVGHSQASTNACAQCGEFFCDICRSINNVNRTRRHDTRLDEDNCNCSDDCTIF